MEKDCRRNRNLLVVSLLLAFLCLAIPFKVYAGTEVLTPENVKVELKDSDQIVVSWTMSSYMNIVDFDIISHSMEEIGKGGTATYPRPTTPPAAGTTVSTTLKLSSMCPVAGKYVFQVVANSYTDSSAAGEASFTAPEIKSEESGGSGGSGDSSGGSSGSSGSGSSGSSSSGSSSSGGSSGSGNSGGSGSGSNSGSSPSSTAVTPTDWNKAGVTIYSTTPGLATINLKGYDYGIGVQVYKGKTLVASKSLGYYGYDTVYSKIPYSGKTTFSYRVLKYGANPSALRTITVKSAKLRKPSLAATKISSTRAGLKWNSVAGATGYRVYKGSKLVKTLSKKKTSYIVKGKGAGSAKYKVAAIIKSGKTYAGPKSKAKKGKVNARTYNYSKNYKAVKLFQAHYSISRITLEGNTYTITGYVLNNRMFKMLRYKNLDIKLYCDGKKVAHKKFKNLKVGCPDYGCKKLTIKIKGKGGVDFRNATGITYSYTSTPYWEVAGTKQPGEY